MRDLQTLKREVIQGTYRSEKFDQTKVQTYRKNGRMIAQVWVKDDGDKEWRRSFYFFPEIDTRLTGEIVHYTTPSAGRSVDDPVDPYPHGRPENI